MGVVVRGSQGEILAYTDLSVADLQKRVLAAAITDREGRATLTLPPGTYRIRVQRIGVPRWVSDPIELGSARELTVEVPSAAIELPGLVATGEDLCAEYPADERAVGAELLVEVLPRIAEIRAFELDPDVRFAMEVTRPKKTWRKPGGGWTYYREWQVDTVAIDRPIEGAALDSLGRPEFATPIDDTTNLYQPPDAGLLASEAFWTGYCLTGRRLSEQRAEIDFRPKERVGRVDIAGTLQLAPVSSGELHLSRVDFHYVDLEPFVREFEYPKLEIAIRKDHEGYRPGLRFFRPQIIETDLAGYLEFGEVQPGMIVGTEWSVSGIHLSYAASFTAGQAGLIYPATRSLPTSARVLAVILP